ncbi:MAG: veratrol--corrinoid protein metyltransferase [Clostridiales bacterium]|nr:veratrol--corrinoid protein metyltransferase [Clostridiales bacterium]
MGDPLIMGGFRGPQGGIDPWGVRHVTNKETNYSAIPEPNNFILRDITKWRDAIKMPEYGDFDWEAAAIKDRETLLKDPEQSLFVISGMGDLFQQFISFMGFVEGLCAIFEEPETVEELFDFMLENTLYITKNVLYYYKPDGYYLLDDTASKLQPFVSPQVFEKLLVPRYKKILDPVVNAGVPIFYHNCGRCEDLLSSMVELGVKVWDPAQPVNDLKAIKNRYGNQLVINGGYEYDLPIRWTDVDEEEVRQTVRDTFELLAPGGGYVFSGGVKSLDLNDPDVQRVNGWIRDEAQKLSETFYS